MAGPGIVKEICSTCFVLISLFSMIHCTRKVTESKLHQEQDTQSTYFLAVEHSFDQGSSPKFTSRGTLSFRSNKPGTGLFVQNSPLTAGEKRKLKDLAHNNGIYRLRVPTNLEASSEENAVEYVTTFSKACAILESHLSDDVTVHIDQSGYVLGVSVVPLRGSCDQESMDSVESSSLDYFNTTVSLYVTVPGPVPETQAYIQKLEEERLQKQGGNGADNRSFFGKYWMYIVPVVLFVLLSSGGDQARGGS